MSSVLRNRLFFFVVFFAIFTQIPRFLQLNFIGAFMGKDLSIYPLLIAFAYYAWNYKKAKDSFSLTETNKKFIWYIAIYVGVVLISFFHGLLIYPYYDAILAGPVDQIEKLPAVYQKIQQVGIPMSEVTLLKLWIMARLIKGFALECVWFFGVPLLIYHWFKKDAHRGISILQKATVCAVVLVSLYGILDIFYLSGSPVAQAALVKLNPIVHEIKSNGTWWPPLLWNNQLRSLFAEPSYFGIYSAFAMPWLWYAMLKTHTWQKKLGFIFLVLIFTSELFFTKARTANALFWGELVLLIGVTVWQREKAFFKNTALILVITVLTFGATTYAMSFMPGSPNLNAEKSMGYGTEGSPKVALYLEDNLGSITSGTQRSNLSRYSILKANMAIGQDYPLLGIGKNLRNAYIPDYLPQEAFAGSEIQMWIHNQKEKGIMKSGFPSLGEYYTRFAETGILGLLIYLFPSLYLFGQLIKRIRSSLYSRTQKEGSIFFFLSLAGVMASGLGDNLSITCCYWILIGIGYAFIMPEKMNQDNE